MTIFEFLTCPLLASAKAGSSGSRARSDQIACILKLCIVHGFPQKCPIFPPNFLLLSALLSPPPPPSPAVSAAGGGAAWHFDFFPSSSSASSSSDLPAKKKKKTALKKGVKIREAWRLLYCDKGIFFLLPKLIRGRICSGKRRKEGANMLQEVRYGIFA